MANLNDTLVNGNLKVTDTIYGNLVGNVTGSSGSCTGNAATATTASNCTGNAETATKLIGFTGRSSATLSNFPWGHIKDYKSSYNALVTDIYYQASGKDSGDIAIAYRQEGTTGNDWRLDCQIDGYWYQNLGNKRCIDTGEVDLKLSGSKITYNSSTESIDFTF